MTDLVEQLTFAAGELASEGWLANANICREAATALASLREEVDRIGKDWRFQLQRASTLGTEVDALRERVRVLEDEVRSVGKAYERLVDRGEAVRTNEPTSAETKP